MSETKNVKTAEKSAVKKAEEKKAPVAKVNKSAKSEAVPLMLDRLLWLLSVVIIVAAIGGNFYYTQHYIIDESTLSRLVRTVIVIATIIVGLAVVLFTNKGRALLTFGRESYIELRKVVWPTRQEAMQTTFIVFVAVCLVSLFLYLCDLVVLQVVRAITL